MSTDPDQARLIAERVARRMSGGRSGPSTESSARVSRNNGAPVSEELTAIRTSLHDLERKLDRVESKIVQGAAGTPNQSRARVIDFVSSTPPPTISPSIASPPPQPASVPQSQFVPATHSPWVRDFGAAPAHVSQERFGVEEAAVSELVEFFESEKKCSVEPGGKPCDHCAMCSSRGF
ncbi:MAG TPA: hypothetical protein VHE60_15905 [Pyrinomonadaceae bacterium]|nr:hypothetical protein [Pyrinomonadaceae bacterium]